MSAPYSSSFLLKKCVTLFCITKIYSSAILAKQVLYKNDYLIVPSMCEELQRGCSTGFSFGFVHC